jgi:hypothetical protein
LSANQEQQKVIAAVRQSVEDSKEGCDKNRLFFMEGPAGTGKTFTYRVLWQLMKSYGYNVMCAAFTGAAAILLPEGRTLHSSFGLPVPITEDSTSGLKRHYSRCVDVQKFTNQHIYIYKLL